jgi:hypothetical protein
VKSLPLTTKHNRSLTDLESSDVEVITQAQPDTAETQSDAGEELSDETLIASSNLENSDLAQGNSISDNPSSQLQSIADNQAKLTDNPDDSLANDFAETSVQQQSLEDYLSGETFQQAPEVSTNEISTNKTSTIEMASSQIDDLVIELPENQYGQSTQDESIQIDDVDNQSCVDSQELENQQQTQEPQAVRVDESLLDAQTDSESYEHEVNELTNDFKDKEELNAMSPNTDDVSETATIEEKLENERVEVDELHQNEDIEQLVDNLTNQIEDSDTDPDPLDEFESRVEKKPVGFRNMIILTALSALLVIGGLKFWNNRQTLAWDETWGGMTQTICGVLPCNLEPRRDVAKIRLKQRQVVAAKEHENKLDIKLSLVNTADFDQPYPRITIKFSNSSGQFLTQKQVTVADYFPEKKEQLMSANGEIHIGFQVDMPHTDAVGFEFIFD